MNISLSSIIRQRPQAYAEVRGDSKYPKLNGSVYFYGTAKGVLVVATVYNLPSNDDVCKQPVFAFHIHSGEKCSGNAEDEFANAKGHFNPRSCEHPYHAGDMPPLFGCGGFALSAFMTDRFSVKEIIGRTLIIHSSPDDFTTQPSGNSGVKIACGEIKRV